ncbi:MAG: UDP-N-acetylmuramoyl-L-alanine--D-glutamate ligase [Dethiobacteraceae bacterium]|nr:UDP-N-acetylmuramoyl-L-alanine--D-glutamate ligase [Bacillota bacterium]
MDLLGKEVLVIGLARSGMASALLLLQDGARVTINDKRSEAELTAEEQAFLAANPALRFVGGGHPANLVTEQTALIIKNPGVPLQLPPLQRAVKLSLPVITEVEYAAWRLNAPLVGITGTNGKTTTTALTGEMFRAAGRKTYVAGNIGLPLSAVVNQVKSDDVVVAELSSFQLEATLSLRPRLAAILNITPDHLDHHGTWEAYREAKAKIFAHQRAEDAIVLNADDPEAYALRQRPHSRVYLFSRLGEVERGAFVREGLIILRDGAEETVLCPTAQVAIPGSHNLENALAAALLAWLGGVPVLVIAEALAAFPGVEHRLEYVRTVDGVVYINDSKGTNVDASLKALAAFPQQKVLIAGGYEKGADFAPLARALVGEVSHVVLLGQVAERLAAALREAGYENYSFADSLAEAVQMAQAKAKAGEVVLLSPACASWDMFRDYEERGDLFKEAVWQLRGQDDGR